MSKVKEKKYQDLIFLYLNASVRNLKVLTFEQGGDGVWSTKENYVCLRWIDSKRVSWRRRISQEFHLYGFHQDVPWFERGILVERYEEGYRWVCCQVFKLSATESGAQRPGGLAQNIELLEWKWEMINMDFITGLPRSRRQHKFIWVIIKRMTKSAHFLR